MKSLDTSCSEPTNENLIKVPKVFKPTNKTTELKKTLGTSPMSPPSLVVLIGMMLKYCHRKCQNLAISEFDAKINQSHISLLIIGCLLNRGTRDWFNLAANSEIRIFYL